ncbi:MAG: SecY-interacting protein Syd [Gammaproteobacteria bacterium]|nr:SecY-interacting protein Syd [Gammaproteobacteria bacterium]MCZ6855246.1 SecY-interacting protein Syd [Gammaproteobacteria bacterium]
MAVTEALDAFIEQYRKARPHLEGVHDPRWRSPCEISEPYRGADGIDRIAWEPLKRNHPTTPNDFSGLERALELEIHPDLKTYYGAYWSGGLEAEAPQGHVSLLFLWNDEDIDRLTENLVGHAIAKRRSRSAFSVFFACTEEDSELFLSVENESGRIILERPGYKPLKTVASNLSEFLGNLVPATPNGDPEKPPPASS